MRRFGTCAWSFVQPASSSSSKMPRRSPPGRKRAPMVLSAALRLSTRPLERDPQESSQRCVVEFLICSWLA
jgi:hypothetical protein